jgi:hypothetical protein
VNPTLALPTICTATIAALAANDHIRRPCGPAGQDRIDAGQHPSAICAPVQFHVFAERTFDMVETPSTSVPESCWGIYGPERSIVTVGEATRPGS